MIILREWAMPNKNTFSIPPIGALIKKYLHDGRWIDPFVRNSIYKSKMKYCNDLNKDIDATHNIDALDFMRLFGDNSMDGVLFDPPYSPRQIAECYQGIGKKTTMKDTQSRFWGDLKYEIARVLKPGGICISFGWNSGGLGSIYDCHILEVLIVAHGGWHNDTICTVDQKSNQYPLDFQQQQQQVTK